MSSHALQVYINENTKKDWFNVKNNGNQKKSTRRLRTVKSRLPNKICKETRRKPCLNESKQPPATDIINQNSASIKESTQAMITLMKKEGTTNKLKYPLLSTTMEMRGMFPNVFVWIHLMINYMHIMQLKRSNHGILPKEQKTVII